MNKRVIITGICGQDGFWLTKMLLQMGYEVHGMIRRHNYGFLDYLPKEMLAKIHFHLVDVTDKFAVDTAIRIAKPNEIYHFAAFSSVRHSWTNPELAFSTDTLGTLNILESVRQTCHWDTKIFFPGSSEMFGNPPESPQTLQTPFNPVSPYGIAKLAAFNLCRSYRDAYKMFIALAVPYNHDSAYRSADFVMRKIALAAVKISRGEQDMLQLGDLDAQRDFSHAHDVVRGYYQMMQEPESIECLFASGETHSIREICEIAFNLMGIPLVWEKPSNTLSEVGINETTRKPVIGVTYEHFRPTKSTVRLCGNAVETRRKLNWAPEKKFCQIIEEMVKFDLAQEAK